MKNATNYLVVGSLGILMTRRDISSLAVKGLNKLFLNHMCNGCQVVDRIGSTLLTFPDDQFSRKMK